MSNALTVPLKLDLTLTPSPETRHILSALGILASEKATHPFTGLGATVVPPSIGLPWESQGGIYGGLRPAILGAPAAHMVWSEQEWEDLTWGERGRDIPGARSRVDGQANTRALLAVGDCPAAKAAANYTRDGHSDFFLPSQFDLFIASLLAPAMFKKEGWYWSSTQLSAISAFAQDFEYGYSHWCIKDGKFRVRALRLIQL